MCHLWCAVYLSTNPHHREQLQQVLREGQDRGGDTLQEEESILGGRKARWVRKSKDGGGVSLKIRGDGSSSLIS